MHIDHYYFSKMTPETSEVFTESQVLDIDAIDFLSQEFEDDDDMFLTRECSSCGDIIDDCSQVCGYCARSWSMKQ